jgi:hypothetical protein
MMMESHGDPLSLGYSLSVTGDFHKEHVENSLQSKKPILV